VRLRERDEVVHQEEFQDLVEARRGERARGPYRHGHGYASEHRT
jgi:hypothetical protein